MPKKRPGMVDPSDPILRKVAEEIPSSSISSKITQDIIEQLLRLAYGEQTDRKKPVLVGLAAPQAGISKRIILVDIGADGHGGVSNLQVFINPQVISTSQEKEEWYEGCYSTSNVCGIVARPKKIRVAAFDRNGNKLDQEYSGYTARIFLHEIDHLDGKEFITHITDDTKLHWVEDDEFPQYRDHEAWRTWPKKCPRERWEQIKSGKSISE